MSTSSYLFPVPQTALLTADDYDALCVADARGDTVFLLMPNGERVHINHIAFDVPRSAPNGVLFRVKKEIPESEYRNTKSARGKQ